MVYKQSPTNNKRKIIDLKNICKNYNQKSILDNVNLSIPVNSIYALIGPNGAGKTTLLRIILGLIEKSSGKVENHFSNNDISALLENDYLFQNKTGQNNINDFAKYFSIDISKNKKLIDEYITCLGLQNDLNKMVQYYSKGMKRKLSILITLIRNTSFLVLDEPTSGVDPQSRIEIRKLFSLLKNQNKTILVTSHDLAEITKVSDYISVIKSGQIIDTFKNDSDIDLEKKFFEVINGGI
jgi:ABC-type multidrug transport system, ATPase component